MERGVWKKGSRSNGTGGSNCVEVQCSLTDEDNVVLVRHSKHPHGIWLTFTHEEWVAFTESVKLGEFDI